MFQVPVDEKKKERDGLNGGEQLAQEWSLNQYASWRIQKW